MKINTKDFGQVEINEEETIEFQSAIYGFEHTKRFVILSDTSFDGVFLWLQSIEDSDVRFILVDPNAVVSSYRPKIPLQIRRLLDLSEEEAPLLLVIAVIPEEFSKTTVNLKSPIVINCRKRYAAQVILEEDYPIRAPLIQAGEEKIC